MTAHHVISHRTNSKIRTSAKRNGSTYSVILAAGKSGRIHQLQSRRRVAFTQCLPAACALSDALRDAGAFSFGVAS